MWLTVSRQPITWFAASIDENHTKGIMHHRKIYRFSLEAVSRYNKTYNRSFCLRDWEEKLEPCRGRWEFFLALLIPTTLHQPPYEALRSLKRFPVSRLNLLKRAARFRMGQLFLPLPPAVTLVIYSTLYLSPKVFSSHNFIT